MDLRYIDPQARVLNYFQVIQAIVNQYMPVFCREYACIFDRCCEDHACAGVYGRQVL